jgi:hypothetical protein
VLLTETMRDEREKFVQAARACGFVTRGMGRMGRVQFEGGQGDVM